MIVIQCAHASTGARLLAQAVHRAGVECRYLVGENVGQATVLHWGQGGGNKYDELVRLARAGVPVPLHSQHHHAGWLARRFQHIGANDLTAELREGDYYVQYVPTVREHRIHIFDGNSIRVQTKVPRVKEPHPRFRSYDNGWKLISGPEYTAQVPRGAREAAKRAVRAMGYLFGAVDIGVKEDNSIVIFEVNTQPGIEGSTVDAYARAVVSWAGR